MPLINDTFTEAADTNLVNHVPDTGTGWTEEENTTTAIQKVIAASDIVRADAAKNSQRHIYSAQPNPSTVEYDIAATLKAVNTGSGGSDDSWFFVARFTDTSNFYSAGTYGGAAAADKKIFKEVAGVITELASGDNGLAANDTLEFRVRDATKKLFHNGVEVLSTTDNALTSAGRAGFGLGNEWVSTDDITTLYEADNFSVTEVGGVGQKPRRTLMGVGRSFILWLLPSGFLALLQRAGYEF